MKSQPIEIWIGDNRKLVNPNGWYGVNKGSAQIAAKYMQNGDPLHVTSKFTKTIALMFSAGF